MAMGNPAGMRRKKSEKRRAKFEARLGGPLAYIPKDAREEAFKAIAAEEQKLAAEAAKKK
jgi:hypothetical protein